MYRQISSHSSFSASNSSNSINSRIDSELPNKKSKHDGLLLGKRHIAYQIAGSTVNSAISCPVEMALVSSGIPASLFSFDWITYCW